MSMQQNQAWLKDYEEFLNSDQASVPAELSQKVSSHVAHLMNPSAGLIFAKMLGLHLVTGTLSLAICHQFGFNPVGTSFSLEEWFMQVGGHHFCMLACGVLFLSLTLLAAGAFLSIEEILVLKRTRLLQTSGLALFSLGFFLAFGAQFALTIGLLWLAGGLIGGWAATEITSRWRLA